MQPKSPEKHRRKDPVNRLKATMLKEHDINEGDLDKLLQDDIWHFLLASQFYDLKTSINQAQAEIQDQPESAYETQEQRNARAIVSAKNIFARNTNKQHLLERETILGNLKSVLADSQVAAILFRDITGIKGRLDAQAVFDAMYENNFDLRSINTLKMRREYEKLMWYREAKQRFITVIAAITLTSLGAVLLANIDTFIPREKEQVIDLANIPQKAEAPVPETEEQLNKLHDLQIQAVAELLEGTKYETYSQDENVLRLLEIIVDNSTVIRDEYGRPLILPNNVSDGEHDFSDFALHSTEDPFQEVMQTEVAFPLEWTNPVVEYSSLFEEPRPPYVIEKTILQKMHELQLDELPSSGYIQTVLESTSASIRADEQYEIDHENITNSKKIEYVRYLESYLIYATYIYQYTPDGIANTNRESSTITLQQEQELFTRYIESVLSKLTQIPREKHPIITTAELTTIIQSAYREVLAVELDQKYADLQTIDVLFLTRASRLDTYFRSNLYYMVNTSDKWDTIIRNNEELEDLLGVLINSLTVSRFPINNYTIAQHLPQGTLHDTLLSASSPGLPRDIFVDLWPKIHRDFWYHYPMYSSTVPTTYTPIAEKIKNLEKTGPGLPSAQTSLDYVSEWLQLENTEQ